MEPEETSLDNVKPAKTRISCITLMYLAMKHHLFVKKEKIALDTIVEINNAWLQLIVPLTGKIVFRVNVLIDAHF